MEGLAWGVLRASLGPSGPGFCEQDVVWIFGCELLDVQHFAGNDVQPEVVDELFRRLLQGLGLRV